MAVRISESIHVLALAANHLLTVELGGKRLERRFDDAATQAKDEMECRFLGEQTANQHE